MPLEKYNKISLIHKESKKKKVLTDTSKQEVPQSTLRADERETGGNILKKTVSGSLTVEAALVFPLFLFALISILFFFRVLEVERTTSGALASAGSRLSLELDAEDEAMARAVAYFQKELLNADDIMSYVAGGRLGIGWSGTQLAGEYVDLQIHYSCNLPIRLFGIGSIPISQRVCMKKWTGYKAELNSETDETWVYITPEGTVYHNTKECTHLRLSIGTMGREEAQLNGYTPCLLCKNDTSLYSYYYVTDEGRRYHKRLDCSGLKRTVYMIRISQAEGRTACTRCGG